MKTCGHCGFKFTCEHAGEHRGICCDCYDLSWGMPVINQNENSRFLPYDEQYRLFDSWGKAIAAAIGRSKLGRKISATERDRLSAIHRNMARTEDGKAQLKKAHQARAQKAAASHSSPERLCLIKTIIQLKSIGLPQSAIAVIVDLSPASVCRLLKHGKNSQLIGSGK